MTEGNRPLPRSQRIGVMNSLILISPEKAWGFQPILSGKGGESA
ncbi:MULTISPECIES: hypothetical protein [unclassified Microcoleus]|nr:MULTISPECIES: hypothetical protein [unclassified Microcoleus]